jgi:hypothetical protein
MQTNYVENCNTVYSLSCVRDDNNTFAAGDQKILAYALDAYGFLIKRRERLTLPEFADRIAEVYDLSCPQNAAVVATLRKYPPMEVS